MKCLLTSSQSIYADAWGEPVLLPSNGCSASRADDKAPDIGQASTAVCQSVGKEELEACQSKQPPGTLTQSPQSLENEPNLLLSNGSDMPPTDYEAPDIGKPLTSQGLGAVGGEDFKASVQRAPGLVALANRRRYVATSGTNVAHTGSFRFPEPEDYNDRICATVNQSSHFPSVEADSSALTTTSARSSVVL